MKALKLKCVLLTEDGENWLVIRQFYASDLSTNEFLDDKFQGMKLKTVDKLEENNDKTNRERA